MENNYQNRVGFWVRFGAYMIDFGFIIIFGVILGLIIGEDLAPILFSKQMAEFDQMNQLSPHMETLLPNFKGIMTTVLEISVGTNLVGFILIILEGSTGQSIGKMLLKIKNTNVDGNPATPQQLWIRALLKYGAGLISIIAGLTGIAVLNVLGTLVSIVIFIGYFLVFMDARQAIHDMLAKTIVSKI